MQPVFKEYTEFLKAKGVDTSWYRDNIFWLDRNTVKYFDKSGSQHSVLKIKILDDLSLIGELKEPVGSNIECWEDTIKRCEFVLNQLEEESIALINRSISKYPGRQIVDTNSTGKDSMVKTKLLQKSGHEFMTYFNVTTIDVGESTILAKEQGYEFILPDLKRYGGFYQYCTQNHIVPSRLNRFCCTYYKESPTIDYFDRDSKLLFLFGMRNDESNHRSSYENEWKNLKWGKRDWVGILPIRKWSELFIWLYILKEHIPINNKYKYGYTRVGCSCACPNYTKTTWALDQYWYPLLYSRWRTILKDDFLSCNKWLSMNCTLKEYMDKAWTGGSYRSYPTNEVIEEFAKHNDLTFAVAEQYFQKHCTNGCTGIRNKPLLIKDKYTISMNLKIYGRNIQKFKCKKCIMKEMGWDESDWKNKINQFRESECSLFN